MQFLSEYGLFLLKAVTLVASILIMVAGATAIASKAKEKAKDKLNVRSLREKFEDMAEIMSDTILGKKAFKNFEAQQKEKFKTRKKELNASDTPLKRIFVVNFHGDIQASAVRGLREEVTAILTVANSQDEVLIRIESGGGTPHGYGLAASQLERIKQRGIPLVAAVDKVAASGGYLMASVADRIIAAPFAIIGSVGVIAQLPNFHRLLKKHNIDYEQISAGEYKRTLTVFGENTKKGREKFQEQVEELHEIFKGAITRHRPFVNISEIATGETWLGTRAIELKLVDELMTSDDYLLNANDHADLFEISYTRKKSMGEKLAGNVAACVDKIYEKFRSKSEEI